jgi:hypothetical protein
MAPNSLKTVGEFASQLSQEFGDRDSQILRLEVENARLRALLEAATSHNPDFTTTNATPNVQPQFREVTAETRQQSEDALMDEACDVTGVDGDRSHRLPEVASGRSSITRRTECSFHYQNPSSDDDEDPIPRPKKEKAPLTAAAKDAPARTSHLGATVAAESSKRKRAPSTFVYPTSQASQENETRPAKRSRPPLAASSRLKEVPTTNKQTPTKKRTHLPHAYTPLQKSPFQRSSNATAPPPPLKKQQSSSYRYSGSSGSSEGVSKDNNTTRPSQPKWPKQKNQPQPANTATKRASTYAEITPFTFKFVHSYTTPPNISEDGTPEMLVFDSDTLKNTMSSFWKALTSLLDTWEEQAGADWAWEVQKKVKSRGGNGAFQRVCVTSQLDDELHTKWRHGDSGFFACSECAKAAKPCFTWVRDEGGGEEGDDDEVFGAPKGEFWCLPVHKDDRRCKEVKGKEIRSRVNEVESLSDEDGSGEESDESGFDAYDDDNSELTSEASSQESSEEVVDSDGEL